MRRRLVENRRDFPTAKKLRETFVDRPMSKVIDQQWSWPRTMDEIGVCTAVMYKSDKWKRTGDTEDYKHVNESDEESHKLLISRDFDLGLPRGVEICPQSYELSRMPDTIAELANILGLQFRLYDEDGELEEQDYQVNIGRHVKIGAAVHPNGETVLLVYSKSTLCCIITGFDVEKDGIVR